MIRFEQLLQGSMFEATWVEQIKCLKQCTNHEQKTPMVMRKTWTLLGSMTWRSHWRHPAKRQDWRSQLKASCKRNKTKGAYWRHPARQPLRRRNALVSLALVKTVSGVRCHGTGDRWQVSCNRWQVTGDRCHVAGDRWQVSCNRWQVTCQVTGAMEQVTGDKSCNRWQTTEMKAPNANELPKCPGTGFQLGPHWSPISCVLPRSR